MEWVSARDLIIVAGGVTNRASPASKAICRWAHGGLLRTRARLYRVNGAETLDCDLPKGFWWTEGEPALEQDWERGDFSWTSGLQKATALGVQFAKVEAEDLGVQFKSVTSAVAGAVPPAATKVAAENKGGRKQSEKWSEFVAELCAYFHEEGVPLGEGTEGAESVMEAVATRLMERGIGETLARSTTQPAVNAALKRLRALS